MKKLLIFLMIIMIFLTGCGRKTEYTRTFETKEKGAEAVFSEITTDYAGERFLSGAHNAAWLEFEAGGNLPLYKMESMEELEQFEEEYGGWMNGKISGRLMYIDEKYQTIGEDFFEERILLMVYSSGSSSCRLGVKGLNTKKSYATVELYCTVEKSVPHAEDDAGRMTAVAVERDAVKKCTEFDAVMAGNE